MISFIHAIVQEKYAEESLYRLPFHPHPCLSILLSKIKKDENNSSLQETMDKPSLSCGTTYFVGILGGGRSDTLIFLIC